MFVISVIFISNCQSSNESIVISYYNKALIFQENEINLSAFLKLGMNTKEICSITIQSVRTLEASRLRQGKKLDLAAGENLSMFLQKY